MFVRIVLTFLWCAIILSCRVHAQTIEKISFEGLTKTKESYLKNLINCKEGGTFDQEKVQKDEQILKNLNLFFRVNYTVIEIDTQKYNVTFSVEEAKYLYPILSASGFKSQFKLQAGFNQINFRGRAENLGFVYQYYDRHSFSLFYGALRHSNAKTGHEVALTKYSTIEPLYFNDTVSAFNFDNYGVSAEGHYWIKKNLRAGLGGMYMYEKYEQLDSATIDLGQTNFNFHKYQIKSFLEYNGLNQNFERIKGSKNRFYLESIQTKGFPMASFFKATNDFYWFRELNQRGNLGVHNRLALATNNFSPFSPFVLDGFVNVRGIGNRVSRGTAELITNVEYRHCFWRHKLFILQGVVFADLGTLRQPGEKLINMFNYRALNLFTGAGIRVHSQFFYKVIFRLDYSFNPLNTKQHGLTFGVGQFF